jgi:hypothetical protein
VHSRSRSRLSLLGSGLVFASGCARAVLPSEKAYLADPIMQFGADPLEAAADAHIQDNREGSTGGRGTTGGGCGCN